MTAEHKVPISYLVQVHADNTSDKLTFSFRELDAAQRAFSVLRSAQIASETGWDTSGWMNLVAVLNPHDDSVPRILLQQDRWDL